MSVEPLLTIREACELVGVSRRTIYNWLRSNRLRFVRTAGGSVRIYRNSLFRAPTPSRTKIPVDTGSAVEA